MIFSGKRKYFYLVAGLPDLLLDESKVKLSAAGLRDEWQNDLTAIDFRLVQELFRKYDNNNLLNLLQKNEEPFDSRGNFSQDFLEAQIKEPTGLLPPYMSEFITMFKADLRENPSRSWENILEEMYYEYARTLPNEFLCKWFEFQMNLRNVLTGLNCRQFGYNPHDHLIGNNSVVESILRSNARDFGLSQDFPEIEQILSAWETSNITEQQKAIDMLQWNWIEQEAFFYYFTIERILAFLLQFEMVERWMKLDKATGEQLFRELLKNLGSSYKLPAEFTLQHITRR